MIQAADFLVLIGGLVYLTMGGDLLVRGAMALSRRTGISPTVIGLTVVALGTSAPELIVSLQAALTDHPDIAIGNVVGSNVANVLIVLGLPALLSPITQGDDLLKGHARFMLGISAAFAVLCLAGPLRTPHGLALLAVLALGAWLSLRGTLSLFDVDADEEEVERVLGIPTSVTATLIFIALGILLLPLGASLVVDRTALIARGLGVGEAVIAASIVAFGTSLPELGTTVLAALHRQPGVALGNVIGSNVLNILLIVGATASVAPVPVPPSIFGLDIWVMLGSSALLVFLIERERAIGRATGVLLLAGYAAYLFALFV